MKKPAHKRPVHVTRWRNFRQLIGSDPGAITDAANRLEKKQGQVSHFGGKNPTKPIGDQIAAEIEEAWHLPPGWLDLNHSDEGQPTNLGKTEQQSQPVQLDPKTLAQAFLLATQEAVIEGQKKYDLVDDPERTVRAYNFLAAGPSYSEVAGYTVAALRRAKQATGEVKSGKVARAGNDRQE